MERSHSDDDRHAPLNPMPSDLGDEPPRESTPDSVHSSSSLTHELAIGVNQGAYQSLDPSPSPLEKRSGTDNVFYGSTTGSQSRLHTDALPASRSKAVEEAMLDIHSFDPVNSDARPMTSDPHTELTGKAEYQSAEEQQSSFRRRAATKVIHRAGSIFLAITWDMAMQFSMWKTFQPDPDCEAPQGRTHNFEPGSCVPTQTAAAIQLSYALVISLVCGTLVYKIRKAMNEPDAKPAFRVFGRFCTIGFGALIPAWAWTNAVMEFSEVFGGIGLSFAFALIITVFSTVVVYVSAKSATFERLRSPVLTADLKTLSTGLGLATANAWGAAVTLAMQHSSTIQQIVSLQLVWAIVTTAVVAFVFSRIKLHQTDGPVWKHHIIFLLFEVAADVVGLAWNQVIFSTFQRLDLSIDNIIASYTAYAVFVVVLGYLVLSRLHATDSDIEAGSFSRQTVHLISNAFSVMIGQAWGKVATSLFLLFTGTAAAISAYFLYAVFVTCLFFALVYVVTKLPFTRGVIEDESGSTRSLEGTAPRERRQ